ncbi:MAG: ATP-binding protein, partial [candidate division WOR-3 bacterium]
PFLFIISLISSYWAESTRRVIKEKERLEQFNIELKKEVEKIAAREIELRQYNEKIIASVSSGIMAIRNDSIITTINPEAERIMGFTPGEMIGLSIKDMPGLIPLWEKMRKSMQENTPIIRDEVIIRNKNNNEIPIGFNITPMSDNTQAITGCVVIFKDLSDIRKLQEQLKQAERLSYLGKMSSWVAHEIRNPLTTISGFAQLLLTAKDKKKIALFSSEINKAAQRINHIIDDILTFARSKRIAKDQIPLLPMITSIVAGLKINVSITGEKNLVIKGETESIRRLFINIINNSVEAMDENGKLVIDFSHNKNFSIITIRDNGKGISAENLKHLFEPFFTTKPRGTGLGLAIIKKIVEEHNGKIEIESEENKGTTCRVYLPRD